jgi:hypothetical protein
MGRFDAEYHRRHAGIRRALGQARLRKCAHCDGQAQEWATIHGRDGWDFLADYMPLCRKCHAAYDDRARKVSEARTGTKGQPKSEETRRKMGEARRRHWAGLTDEQRAERIKAWRANRWPGKPVADE